MQIKWQTKRDTFSFNYQRHLWGSITPSLLSVFWACFGDVISLDDKISQRWFPVVLDIQPRPPMDRSQGPVPEQLICQGSCLVMDHLTAVNGGDWHENSQHREPPSGNLCPCCIIKSESLGKWHWQASTRAVGDNAEGKHSCDQMKWTSPTYQQLICVSHVHVYCNETSEFLWNWFTPIDEVNSGRGYCCIFKSSQLWRERFWVDKEK